MEDRITMVLGFTGTRKGLSKPQRTALKAYISEFIDPQNIILVGLHGDCVGADAEFDDVCMELLIATRCRPCTISSMRAHTGATQVATPKSPMARNREIVADADFMIACPPNFEPIKRGSGTWATISMAKRRDDLHLRIIFPDGSYEDSGCEGDVFDLQLRIENLLKLYSKGGG